MLEFTRKDNVAYWRKYPNKLVHDWPESYQSIRTMVGTDALDTHICLREHWLVQCPMPNGKLQNVGVIQETADHHWFAQLDWAHSGASSTRFKTFEQAKLYVDAVFALDNLYEKYVEVHADVPF